MSAFDKVIGYEKEKEELYQLCDMAKNPEKYAALGVKLPRGILLHGVPGVGKTLMASALIEEMGRVCYTCRKDKREEYRMFRVSIHLAFKKYVLSSVCRSKIRAAASPPQLFVPHHEPRYAPRTATSAGS